MATTEYEYIALAFKGGYRATNAPKSPREFTESRGFFYAPAETERRRCLYAGNGISRKIYPSEKEDKIVSIKKPYEAGIRHNHRALLWFQGIGGGAIQQAFCKFGPNGIACCNILDLARTRLYGVEDYQIGWHNLLPYWIALFHLCLASVLWGKDSYSLSTYFFDGLERICSFFPKCSIFFHSPQSAKQFTMEATKNEKIGGNASMTTAEWLLRHHLEHQSRLQLLDSCICKNEKTAQYRSCFDKTLNIAHWHYSIIL